MGRAQPHELSARVRHPGQRPELDLLNLNLRDLILRDLILRDWILRDLIPRDFGLRRTGENEGRDDSRTTETKEHDGLTGNFLMFQIGRASTGGNNDGLGS
jgi:hypothetical protein